jgi:hypothetical protein
VFITLDKYILATAITSSINQNRRQTEMKAHKYEVRCYEGVLEYTHGMSSSQFRVYVPGNCVFGYRPGNKGSKLDFFDELDGPYQEGDELISGQVDKSKYHRERDAPKYIGQIELPDNLTNLLEKLGAESKALALAKDRFAQTGNELVDILESEASQETALGNVEK